MHVHVHDACVTAYTQGPPPGVRPPRPHWPPAAAAAGPRPPGGGLRGWACAVPTALPEVPAARPSEEGGPSGSGCGRSQRGLRRQPRLHHGAAGRRGGGGGGRGLSGSGGGMPNREVGAAERVRRPSRFLRRQGRCPRWDPDGTAACPTAEARRRRRSSPRQGLRAVVRGGARWERRALLGPPPTRGCEAPSARDARFPESGRQRCCPERCPRVGVRPSRERPAPGPLGRRPRPAASSP